MSDLLNKASLVVIPSGYKEDTVYSVVPSDGSGDLSFTRASNGTRVNSAGLVEVVPWNLAQYSEDFSNAYWGTSGTGGSITSNTTTAPNGTLTADTFTMPAGTAYLYNGSFNLPIGEFTQSVYAKANTISSIRLEFVTSGFARGAACIFDLSNGTAGTLTIYGGVSGFTASIESVGNGWYRCSIGGTITISDTYFWEISITTGSIYIWGAQLNIGSTAKPYFPTTDRLNVPRLTYQNGGGGCPSLLLEKQSTNGLYPSEDFSTTWNLFNSATITTNQATSPDGTQNADKITTTNQATAMYNVNGAGTSAQAYTASLFIKYIDNTEFAIGMTDDVTGEAFARFNFTTGTATTTLQGDWTSISYTWEQQANGWYRISVTATKGASGNARFIGKGGGAYNYFIWGAQLEASSYPTSYIPTTSASATRVADACFKTGISSLIGQTEGVMFAEINVPSIATAGNYSSWQLNDGSTSNLIDFTYYSTGRIQAIAFIGGSLQVNIDLTSFGLTAGNHKIAFAYKLNDYVLYVDGVQVGSDTSAQVPAMSKCDLFTGSNQITIYNQFAVFPTRLTNAELASLTTI